MKGIKSEFLADFIYFDDKNITNKAIAALDFFFFLSQQFIIQRMEADYGSYFHNYIQKTHMKLKERRKKKKKKDKGTN